VVSSAKYLGHEWCRNNFAGDDPIRPQIPRYQMYG